VDLSNIGSVQSVFCDTPHENREITGENGTAIAGFLVLALGLALLCAPTTRTAFSVTRVIVSKHLIGSISHMVNATPRTSFSQTGVSHNPHAVAAAFYLLCVFRELNLKPKNVESLFHSP
jgi:hypothetical protein